MRPLRWASAGWAALAVSAAVLALLLLFSRLPGVPEGLSEDGPRTGSPSVRAAAMPPVDPLLPDPSPAELVLPDDEHPSEPPPVSVRTHNLRRSTGQQHAGVARHSIPGPLARFNDLPRRTQEDYDNMYFAREPILAEPKMRNLRGLACATRDVQLEALYAGMSKTEAVLAERAWYLEDLGADGSVPPDRVGSEACALRSASRDCPLEGPACGAWGRLEAMADAVCEAPSVQVAEELLGYSGRQLVEKGWF